MAGNDRLMEISSQVVEDYRSVFGTKLESVILYGSALTHEYIAGQSDLNFLIALSEEGIERLHLAQKLVAKWRKKRVVTPLFLTGDYIASSLDTFPIEFLNIKRNHRVVFGEDMLATLHFNKDFVRMQCERELKGKLLLLRERYVESEGKAKILRRLVAESVTTFAFIFNGLLYVQDKDIPATKQETLRTLAGGFGLDEPLFQSLLRIKEGTLKPSQHELNGIVQKYLKEIRKLALRMDADDFRGAPSSEPA